MARIGIDLGTTNSVVATVLEGGQIRTLPTRRRENLTPSVVSRGQSGELLVGKDAINTARKDPANTIFSVKRLMGRRYHDPEVKHVRELYSYQVVPGDNEMAHVKIGEKSFSPIEISSRILASIKEDASRALGTEVTHAVITVPALFEDNQKAATREAGGMAGLKVLRIVNEPTAAAYAFGMELDPEVPRNVLVYDLGGGTFDVSIISIVEGLPMVETSHGNNWLGGDNFDRKIIEYVLDQVKKREGPTVAEELRRDADFMWRLKTEAEETKKVLGQASSSRIEIYNTLCGRDVEVAVSQTDFLSWIRPDIERSVKLVRDAMEQVELTPDVIDHVLLVGGSTGLPLVHELLKDVFGAGKILSTVDPMQCVAHGAALLAQRSERKYCTQEHENEPDATTCQTSGCGRDLRDLEARVVCRHCSGMHPASETHCPDTGRAIGGSIIDRTAIPYGIGVTGNRFEVIIPKDTPYPTPQPIFREFKTPEDYQERLLFPVYQGFHATADANELQGEIVIPVPQDKRVQRGTPLEVGFLINADCTLEIRVRGKGALSWLSHADIVRPWQQRDGDDVTGPATIDCNHCGMQNRRSQRACINCGNLLAGEKEGPALPEWAQELRFYYIMGEVAGEDYEWIIGAERAERLKTLAEQARRVVSQNDEATGRLLLPQLKEDVDGIEGIWDLIFASVIARNRKGRLDQITQLGTKLREFKQRATSGTPPSDLTDLRGEIDELAWAIANNVSADGTTLCPSCGQRVKPVPVPNSRQKGCPTPTCDHRFGLVAL